MRICSRCEVEKEATDFRRPTGHVCKKCESLRNQSWRAANLEKSRASQRQYDASRKRNRPAWKRHGMAEHSYLEMLMAQEGKCKICSNAMDVVCIDHDHSCCAGKHSCGLCVRGLLCVNCNLMIGLSQDNPEVLISAAKYLGGN